MQPAGRSTDQARHPLLLEQAPRRAVTAHAMTHGTSGRSHLFGKRLFPPLFPKILLEMCFVGQWLRNPQEERGLEDKDEQEIEGDTSLAGHRGHRDRLQEHFHQQKAELSNLVLLSGG